ncbi:ABC-2 type transport system permease protein [Anaerosporobacter mobilis DSM 15930]|uniref:ABC-2 type transport system permease protein n=1 Tax=Anaerosporobacter mobilis DSM 15930 TaxID=1120996 RepID=A0A1M7G2D8_9FIRM|nr:ABC transporter permease [Anaerosporobacter mobilis]SHM10410.1 ABC-2 type transport system permease protein [Anaerosporobacter mobilis DSM 15930]
MNILKVLIRFQTGRRIKEGFSIGYNIIFPILLISILGVLTRNQFGDVITSYQYYTVVMIPFCACMALITAAYAGKEEAYAKTAVRIVMAPISERQIVLSKIFSCTIVFSICNCFTFVICGFIWQLPRGIEWILICLLLVAMSFLVAAIGVLLGTGMKNFLFIKNLINLPVGLCAVAAGVFFPLGTSNPVVQGVLNLSPLTHVNRYLFAMLFDHMKSGVCILILIHVVVGVFISIFAITTFKKEEFLHGDLPGYKE